MLFLNFFKVKERLWKIRFLRNPHKKANGVKSNSGLGTGTKNAIDVTFGNFGVVMIVQCKCLWYFIFGFVLRQYQQFRFIDKASEAIDSYRGIYIKANVVLLAVNSKYLMTTGLLCYNQHIHYKLINTNCLVITFHYYIEYCLFLRVGTILHILPSEWIVPLFWVST